MIEQPVRSRTGPIRPATSMAAMPPSRQDEVPHRVVGGARRVPRMPPPEPTAATDVKPGSKREVVQVDSKGTVSQRPVRATPSVESQRPVRAAPSVDSVKTTRAAPSAEPRTAAVTAKGREVVTQKGKQPSKPVTTKATEKAKPITKPASTQRAGASHARTASSDKGVTVKRGGHVRSNSRDKAVVLAEESKENEHEAHEVDQIVGKEDVEQATEVPLPPSPKQEPAPPPTDVPLPPEVPLPPDVPLPPSPEPQPAQVRPVVPRVEITTSGPATPDRPRDFEHSPLVAQTPISALFADIERGFLFTPVDPLSPAQNYAEQKGSSGLPMLPPLRALRTSRLSDIAE